jgi:endonuclease YncB( thermonuclease family)
MAGFSGWAYSPLVTEGLSSAKACYDGDTLDLIFPATPDGVFRVPTRWRCRLTGFDAPERKAPTMSQAMTVREYLINLVAQNKYRVWTECQGHDKYGRVLATIYPGPPLPGNIKPPSFNHLIQQRFNLPLMDKHGSRI